MKNLISRVCGQILRPLASVFLRCGLTWREFSDISKAAFVDVASGEFGKRGRPTSISRVCILTGIHRKEVKRLRDLLHETPTDLTTKSSDATRMLTGWYHDPDFLDAAGNPRSLRLDDPAAGFSELFVRYGGDTPEQTMLRELKESETIEVQDGVATVLKRYFMPQALSEQNIKIFGTHLSEHAETLKNNLTQQARHRPRFEGAAIEHEMRPEVAAEFHKFIEARGQQLLEEVDEWLVQQNSTDENGHKERVTLGLGIYAIESNQRSR